MVLLPVIRVAAVYQKPPHQQCAPTPNFALTRCTIRVHGFQEIPLKARRCWVFKGWHGCCCMESVDTLVPL